MTMTNLCLKCGKKTKRKRNKFCSKECRFEYERQEQIKIKIKRNCLHCDKELMGYQKKYCSLSCRYRYEAEHIEDFSDFYKKRASSNIGKIRVEFNCLCKGCGNKFKNRHTSRVKFCSKECRVEYIKNHKTEYFKQTNKTKKYCKNCSGEILGKKRLSRKFCSNKCKHEYRSNHREEYSHIYDKISKMHKDGSFKFLYKQSSERMKIKNPSFNPITVEKQKASNLEFYKNNPKKLEQRKARFINAPYRGRGYRDRPPTKLERKVIDLNIDGVRYTGNGKFWVTFKGGKHKNPDFKISGKKKVIEVGDFVYWHTEEEKIKVINSYEEIGYECLYLTNFDIDDRWEESVEKIIEMSMPGEKNNE